MQYDDLHSRGVDSTRAPFHRVGLLSDDERAFRSESLSSIDLFRRQGTTPKQIAVVVVHSDSQRLCMATVTKKELIDRIADQEGCKRIVAKRIIQSFLDAIVDELGNGNRLEFRDFGVFESKIRASRQAQNPKTMDKVYVPSKRTVKFKIGRIMKERMLSTPPVHDEATGLPVEPSAPQKQTVGARGSAIGARKRV